MAKRYFNWKLAVVLVIGLIVLGITAFGLRKWQRSRRAGWGLEAGNKAYEAQKWEEAAQNLGRYLAVVQDDVPVLHKYADAQLNIRPLKPNNVQQVIAAYRNILRIDKSNTEAASKLIEIYLQMGMPGEAELIATRALKVNKSPELRRMLAIALANQRKFKEAAEELRSTIKEHPDQILAYEVLGRLIEQRPEDSLQAPQFWFDEAVKNNPSSALAYIIRAGSHLRSKDGLKALADLEQAEKLDLSDPLVRLHLAREFINTNTLDKAETHLVAVQNIEAANQALWQTWAQLALKLNSEATMLKVAETGLKELSSQPWDFMPLATELYIRCGELDRATDCIFKLHEKDIVPATTAFLEGLVADKKGYGYEAVKHWNRGMQLGDKSSRTRLALAVTLSRLGDKQSAVKQLRTLVSKQPNFFSARMNLARLLAETGNWAEAIEQARVAKQIFPNSLDAALFYIQANIQLLAENQTDKDSPIWQEIEGHLAALEESSDNALPVRVLQLQLTTRRSQFDKAQQLLKDLKDSYPSQLEIAMAEIELLTAQDKTDEAMLKLYDAVSTFPNSISPLRYLAALLVARGEPQECENIIKDSLARVEQPVAKRELGLMLAALYNRWNKQEKHCQLLNLLVNDLPDDALLQRELLRCAEVIKDHGRAQQIVDRIRAIEGENGWQWRYEQAKIWFAQDNFKDQYPQIISLLKENLLANPYDQSSRMLLAAAYERAGELRLAISTYNEALNRSPKDLRIIVPAVAALYKANEYDRADEILHRAANENLFHPDLEKLELQSHLRRGELSSAGDILENLLASDPNNSSVCLSLALLKMRQNRFVEADELLSKLKLQEPNSLPATVAQIELNIRQDNFTEAISLCDEMVNRFNNASAYIIRGRTLASLGQPEKAEEDFEHATIIEPNNAKAWTAKSDFYRSASHFDKAVISIRKAMSLEPETIGIQKRMILLLLAYNDYGTVREGENMLDKALTSNPEDIELRLYKARSLLAEGTAPDTKQATRILQKITEEQPKISEAWVLLSEIALRQEQPAKAMDVALRGLAHRPNDKGLLLLKAQAEAVRSPTLAIPTLKALYEWEPNDIDTAVFLARTYIAAGEPEKAVDLLEKQLVSCNNTPDKQRINGALAMALYKSADKVKSEKIFDSLYQSGPDDPGPLIAQAQLLKDDELWNQLSQKVIAWCQNHPEDIHTPITIANDLAADKDSNAKKIAEDLLQRTLDNNPNSLPAMCTLAMLLQMTGRPEESAELYQQILTLEPDNVVAINNLAWIMCEEQENYQQALELAQRGLKTAPNYIDLIDTRGVAYYKLGQYDKAIQDFTRCLNLYPDGTPSAVASYLHLGKALAKLGQKDEAIENLKKTLELNNKVGGLSAADSAEARQLLEELSKGGA